MRPFQYQEMERLVFDDRSRVIIRDTNLIENPATLTLRVPEITKTDPTTSYFVGMNGNGTMILFYVQSKLVLYQYTGTGALWDTRDIPMGKRSRV